MSTLDTIHELALLLGLWHSPVTTCFPSGNMNDEQTSPSVDGMHFSTIATGISTFVFLFLFYGFVSFHLQGLSGFELLHQTTAFNAGIIFILSCVDWTLYGRCGMATLYLVHLSWSGLSGSVRCEFVSDCIITLHGCTIGIELNSIIEKLISIHLIPVIL